MQFEWDEKKARSNLRKHGVAFRDALFAFFDEDALYLEDQVVDGELRHQLVGVSNGIQLLLVVHTERNHDGENDEVTIRLISARPADRQERKRYGSRSF